jgi:hypothetical protein
MRVIIAPAGNETTSVLKLPGGGRTVRVSEPLALAVGAAVLTALIVVLGPPGTDFAAHAYQSTMFARRGFDLWDNGWYAGRYAFVTYSLLYYPIAAILGIALVAVTGQALAVGAFAAVVRDEFGPQGRWASRTFAVVWPAFVLTAAFPSALGMMLALVALRSLQLGRTARACAMCALTLAASPLAFLLLTLLLAAIALGKRVRGPRLLYPALTVLVLGAFELLLWKLFPSRGRSQFAFGAMLSVLAFCGLVVALTWGVERARVVLWLFVVYGAAIVLAYLVPSMVGDAVTRFEFAALPVVVLALSLSAGRRRPRALVLAAVALGAWLNLAPLASSLVAGERTSASNASYWRPAVAFLRARETPSYRVEAVDTVGHWPALHLARAGIPLARGWFRQDDFPQNAVLYRQLTPPSYLGWLHLMAVRYVVLPDATLDYTAHREAALLRSGRSGLRVVLRARHLTIFEVPRARPIVTGPARARVLSLTPSGALIDLPRAGTYRVAIRYTPYWGASAGCVREARDGMTRLTVPRAGTVKLAFSWTPERALDVVAGTPASDCSPAASTQTADR